MHHPTSSPTAPATVTRVRWGRLLPVVAGIVLLVLVAWTSIGPTPTHSIEPAAVLGGGTSTTPTTAPTTTPTRQHSTPTARSRRRAAAARTSVHRAHALRAHGSGTDAPQLPFTGASTWVAALLGVCLLALGIVLHVQAVRVGMIAVLYRRGILLRPVDCARLARTRGLPRARVPLSRLLAWLLADPNPNAFVRARISH